MSDPSKEEDPIERASRIFAELRTNRDNVARPAAESAARPAATPPPATRGPEATNAPPASPPSPGDPLAAPAPTGDAAGVDAERLAELARLVGQRLQEVAQREARLDAMQRQLDERLRRADRLPDAVRQAAPGMGAETNLALRARLEALERRLAELDRRERATASPGGPAERVPVIEPGAMPSPAPNGRHVGPMATPDRLSAQDASLGGSGAVAAMPVAPVDASPAPVEVPTMAEVAPFPTRAAGDTAAPPAAPASSPPPDEPHRPPLALLALPIVLLAAVVAVVVILGGRSGSSAAVATSVSTSTRAATGSIAGVAQASVVATTATVASSTTAAAAPTTAARSAAAATSTAAATSAAGSASTASAGSASTLAANAAPGVIAPGAPGAPAATALRVLSTVNVGQGLCDLTAATGSDRLYLADDGTEQVRVYDPAAQKQLASFGVRDSLCSIAVDDTGHTIYAPTWARNGNGGYASSQVQAIDVTTGQTRSYGDPAFPSGPFFDAVDHRLYVGNTAQPTVTVIDPTSGNMATWNVGVKVNRIARSSVSSHLYMASPDDNRVVIVDPASGNVLSTLSVGQRPWGVAADPKTGNVLVSSELSGMVSLIDPRTDQVKLTIPTGDHPRAVAVDGDRGRFYVLNVASRTVSTISTDGATVRSSDPLPGSEELTGLAVAPGTGQVFVLAKTHLYVLG